MAFPIDAKFQEVLQKLSAEFHPLKVYLFGSRARGEHTENSDYDIILVVEESGQSRRQREQRAREIIWGKTIPMDIFIYTASEFEEAKQEFSSIAHTAITEGQELTLA